LLGGCIEEDESPDAAIHRELVEEIELDLGEVNFFKPYFWAECDEYIFWAKSDLDISQITLHEGQELAYFHRQELKELEFASHYDQILDEFFDCLENGKLN
ncbi:NUDIX domain-containing protein, partial [Dolichospermum circinale CS-537/05]|nr:NUDIX domain-containing protein [Dolichospermum circinale CS-537/05]